VLKNSNAVSRIPVFGNVSASGVEPYNWLNYHLFQFQCMPIRIFLVTSRKQAKSFSYVQAVSYRDYKYL
jgi:hypothetical protein